MNKELDEALHRVIEQTHRVTLNRVIQALELVAEDIENGDIFDESLLESYPWKERWSAGVFYAIDRIKHEFDR